MFPKYEELPARLRRKVDARLEDVGCTRDELAAQVYATEISDRISALLSGLTLREGLLVALNFSEFEIALLTLVLQRSILYCRLGKLVVRR